MNEVTVSIDGMEREKTIESIEVRGYGGRVSFFDGSELSVGKETAMELLGTGDQDTDD